MEAVVPEAEGGAEQVDRDDRPREAETDLLDRTGQGGDVPRETWPLRWGPAEHDPQQTVLAPLAVALVFVFVFGPRGHALAGTDPTI